MGSIGTSITQPIPAVGTVGTTYATQIDAFLTEVKTRLEAKVPFSAIVGSGSLDANNQAIIDAHYLALLDVGAPPTSVNTAILSLSTYNGDLYWVTNAGTCQITTGANLNPGSVGGIGGDYGSGNPAALNFVDASSQYSFYDDAGGNLWAWVRAKGLKVVSSASASFDYTLQFAGGSSIVMSLPTAFGSGTGVVTMTSGGQMAVAANITQDIVLTGATKIQHGVYKKVFGARSDRAGSGTVQNLPASAKVAGAGADFYMDLNGFTVGERITAVSVTCSKTTTGTTSIKLWQNATGVLAQVGTTTSSTTSGVQTLTISPGTPGTVTNLSSFMLQCIAPANNDEFYNVSVSYDQPA